MKQGIVVCSWSGGKIWLEQCLKTLVGCKYPVTVVFNDGDNLDMEWAKEINNQCEVIVLSGDHYEVGAIKAGWEISKYDEFFFMQDTCEIKDQSIFDVLFLEYRGTSIQWGHRFQSYLGKFRKEILDQIEWPEVNTKTDAVANETTFLENYNRLDGHTFELFGDFSDWVGEKEEHFGRENLRIENDYLRKWKGYWVGR